MRVDLIGQGCESEISKILLRLDLRVMDISGLDVILDMDELTAIGLSTIVTLGGLSYPTWSWSCVRLHMHVSDEYVHGISERNPFKGERK